MSLTLTYHQWIGINAETLCFFMLDFLNTAAQINYYWAQKTIEAFGGKVSRFNLFVLGVFVWRGGV